ncbi:aminotransferase class I/II-fold pyridoxal phosphate-dependent enzyme [Mycobacterium ostraviense]|uniref:aminotransferase class I/II-fold pyridoxal phosphate-dependent enzyme n=1 Tax=Mycobacterium ostraviense TaxID=2738409 RepID=UPI00137B36A1|nr:aminotransferase class I/II-fold pyridoxal phosphate-dependent enzyme [Mycobacterium ostraviense]UGT90554.1 aminotransferase class I/II-fold pyridoxal phosphate-dependent enzyme [Mycobacterium ostraviense]
MKTTSLPLHHPGGSTTPPDRDQILRRPVPAPLGYGGIGLHCPVNPYPLAPHIQNAVIEAVRGQIAAINGYPDSNATVLRTKLAEYVSNHARIPVTPENIWVANGCNEILQQIFRAFAGPGGTALGLEPSYRYFPVIAEAVGAQWRSVPSRAFPQRDIDAALTAIERCQPDVVVIANPNNPTGDSFSMDMFEEVLARLGSGILVIDEAFIEMSTKDSAVELIHRYPDKIAICRTLSQAFTFAGGKLGYMMAAPNIINTLLATRLPYHVSSMTQAAAAVIIDRADEILAKVPELLLERDRMVTALQLAGFDIPHSDTSFFLLGKLDDAHAVWEAYANAGIFLGDVGLSHYLRVSAGLPHENDQFLEATSNLLDLGKIAIG